jgi:hypothetical protein
LVERQRGGCGGGGGSLVAALCPNASPVIVLISNGCRWRDNNQLATAAMDRDSATATQQRQRRRSDGNGWRCGNGHEKYNNQLAKAAMDGDGKRNRATAMEAMEDRR